MSFSLTELTTPLTTAEVEEAIYGVIEAQGTDTSSWKAGAVTRAMITGVSIVLAGVSVLVASVADAGFLSKSVTDWLTVLAREQFGVTRQSATFASGSLTLVNSGGGVFTPAIDDVTASNPLTGAEYRNTEAFSLGVGETVSVAFAATVAGAASSSTVDKITNLVTVLTDVSVTNPLSLIGLDEETDVQLRVRCDSKLGSLSSSGPAGAYDFAAKEAVRAADGVNVGVTRTRSVADGAGNLTTFCATASGSVPGDEADPATDLGACRVSIEAIAETLAITHTTASAVAVSVDVVYTIYVWTDVDTADLLPVGGTVEDKIRLKIQDALALELASMPVGGTTASLLTDKVFRDRLQGVIQTAFPDHIYHIELDTPAADIDLAINEAPALGAIAGTVNLETRQS